MPVFTIHPRSIRYSVYCAVMLSLLTLVALRTTVADDSSDVDFNRDVLPILADACFQCHGPDPANREADLRLDIPGSVFQVRDGSTVISPCHPDESELWKRVTSLDPDVVMPPPTAHKGPLVEGQKAILKRWIEQGASWERHWAFVPPVRPPIPALGDAGLSPTTGRGSSHAVHPIDAFIQNQWSATGLTAVEQAQKLSGRTASHTLLRRLSLDLTGLPPTPDEVAAFRRDHSRQAYLQHVDRLLDSPHFGERMAMWWLDVARYSDTDGYQQDATRTNWPWRDWVIDAFNQNLPFDQFTVEQFAGDLLPNATAAQILATCFHRNHMTNGEGGRDPEESRIDYVIDRVNTTGTVWLGLTLGCAQCHAHKFDPISHEEYYRFFAFFNNIDEDGKAGSNANPYLKTAVVRSVAQAVAQAEQLVVRREAVVQVARAAAESDFPGWLAEQIVTARAGFPAWRSLAPHELQATSGTTLTLEADGTAQASGANPFQDDYRIVARVPVARLTAVRLEVLPHVSHTDQKLSRGASGEFILTNFKLQLRRPGSSQLEDIEIDATATDADKEVPARNYGRLRDTLDDDPRNGWTTEGFDPRQPHMAQFALAKPLQLRPDDELVVVLLQRSTTGDANIGRFRLSVTDQPGNAVRTLGPMPLDRIAADPQIQQPSDVDGELRQALLDQFLFDHARYQQASSLLEQARRQRSEYRAANQPLNVMVLAERASRRPTRVLERGVWDKPGTEVTAGFPAAISATSATADASNPTALSRLDLARWIVAPDNPLTARVVVNHLWQLLFGTGLVRTPEDFGLQGERPTHPELLDWLAVELVEHDWDLKHMMRLMVTSETYQRSSEATEAQRQSDPENRLWMRASRYRLPSWMIRDGALHASGLLQTTIAGPPARPYQPAGVWAEIFMGRFHYEPTPGAAQFRRTLYAFWRRSSSPTFLFDTAQRRVCEVRTARTNTPLQALTLMNDGSRLAAAYALAFHLTTTRSEFATPVRSGEETKGQTLELSSASPLPQIEYLYQAILSRFATSPESAIVARQFQKALHFYQQHPQQAQLLLESAGPDVTELLGDDSSTKDLTPPSPDVVTARAAWMVTASMLLNLDEAITRE